MTGSALELLRKQGEVLDPVLCDTVMPRMHGRGLVHRAHQSCPRFPLPCMPGYASRDITDRGLLATESPFQQKPFFPERPAGQVRKLANSEAKRRTSTAG